MNTTDVLKSAYPAASKTLVPNSQRTFEERYGGPVRSNEQMFNYYNNFYGAGPQNTDMHYNSQEVSLSIQHCLL